MIGILALQGDFALHGAILDRLGVPHREVRRPEELEGVAGLILPGGESTTLRRLMKENDLWTVLRERAEANLPVFGTCAGVILMAREIVLARPGEDTLQLLDIRVRRNAYGRQRESFEADLQVRLPGGVRAVRGAFIRAPIIESVGEQVEVLAEHEGRPVLVRQGQLLGATFHPEVTDTTEIHALFWQMVRGG